MNNLKRILSLALAGVMTLGMMTVGASAAFIDEDQIVNNEAASTMVSLGIINGREDGSFDPKASVNRAEMAKMIAIALNGGDFDFGLASQQKFADVAPDQWFAEYVNYCANLGIISGREDGLFHPADTVTGYEAAKMMLGALGYTSDVFGFTGSNWYNNVIIYATSLKNADDESKMSLFDSVKGQPALAFTRDDAAQLIYNGLKAYTVTITVNGLANGVPTYSINKDGDSLLASKFDAKTASGILTKSEYTAKTGTWTYTIGDKTYYSNTDYSDLFKHNVLVVYTENSKTHKKTILGVSTFESSVLASGVVADVEFDSKKNTIDGVAYDSEKNYTVYTVNADTACTETDLSKQNAWDAYDLIDNDNDGKVDVILVYTTSLEVVASVKDGVVTTDKSPKGGYVVENEDAKKINAETDADLEKNDYVVVTKNVDGTYTLEKIELGADALVTAYDQTDKIYTIGGEKYELNGLLTSKLLTVGTKYNLGIVNGVLVAADAADGSSVVADTALNEVLYIYEVGGTDAASQDALGNESDALIQKVRVYFTDGTTKIIGIDSVDGKTIVKTPGSDKKKTAVLDAKSYGLYSFTVKDGVYSLKALATNESTKTDMLGFTKYNTTINTISKGGESGTATYANDGIFFVKTTVESKDKYIVVTGAQINAWNDTVIISDAKLYANENKTNNTQVIGFGTFSATTIPGAEKKDDIFGYVVSNLTEVYDANANDGKGGKVNQITIWNGSENVTYNVKNTITISKGSFISFKTEGNEITAINETYTESNAGYVTAFTNTKVWVNDSSEKAYTLTDDSVVIYVNTTAGVQAGVADSAIALGKLVDAKDESKGYNKNVIAVVNANNEITALFVATNGKI